VRASDYNRSPCNATRSVRENEASKHNINGYWVGCPFICYGIQPSDGIGIQVLLLLLRALLWCGSVANQWTLAIDKSVMSCPVVLCRLTTIELLFISTARQSVSQSVRQRRAVNVAFFVCPSIRPGRAATVPCSYRLVYSIDGAVQCGQCGTADGDADRSSRSPSVAD